MAIQTTLEHIVIGRISRETIVNLDQKVYESGPGGPALYAAGGMRCWEDRIGIVSEINPDIRTELFSLLDRYHIDRHGIVSIEDASTEHQFFGYSAPGKPVSKNPLPFFSALQKTIPRSLLSLEPGFTAASTSKNFYPSVLQEIYLDASAAHICAEDIHHQLKISTLINKSSVSVLTLLSDRQSMEPGNWDLVMNLMNGLTAFVTTGQQLNFLFKNRLDNRQEMFETLHHHGCEYVILMDTTEGFTLYDFELRRRIIVPAYPVKVIDPTGMEEAFCGGFLAVLRKNHDPVQAMLSASITASLKIEGSGPFFALEATPGLINARLDRLKDWVNICVM